MYRLLTLFCITAVAVSGCGSDDPAANESAGPEIADTELAARLMPDVVGMDVDAATTELSPFSLDVEVRNEPAQAPAGEVIAQKPEAGEPTEGGELVLLSVSSGPRETQIPDVVGLSEFDATDMLANAGFTLVEVTPTESASAEPGTVVTQEPAAGETAVRDETVTITVAEDAPGGGGDEPSAEQDPDAETSGGSEEPAEEPGREVVLLQAGFTSTEVIGDGTVYASMASIVRNESSQTAADVKVTFTLLDADGNAIATEEGWAGHLAAGGEAYPMADAYLDPGAAEPASVRADLTGVDYTFTQAPVYPISQVRYADDEYSDSIVGQVKNPTSTVVDKLHISCAVLADGDVIGGGYTYSDAVAAGSAVAFRAGNGPVEGMERGDEVRCHAAERNWNF